MAHEGTMAGGSAQTNQSGSFWPAIALALALVLAMLGAVWFAWSAGLAAGTAKPTTDRSHDQVEAQRGAVMLSTDAYLNSILDKAHATPYAGGATLSTDAYLDSILDKAHATPFAVGATVVPPSPTSGTFHLGKAAGARIIAQAKRDHVGGP